MKSLNLSNNPFSCYTKPVFVISAPSGTGKTTLVRMLIDAIPEIKLSISTTTRAPRGTEREGIDYHFISEKEFKEKITQGEFIENAQIYGHYYGTSLVAIKELEKNGAYVLLEIDTQGAQIVQKNYHAVTIFITPPSLQELERRLYERNTDSQEVIQARIAWAAKELSENDKFDYRVVNQDLPTCFDVLRAIIKAEIAKSKRMAEKMAAAVQSSNHP